MEQEIAKHLAEHTLASIVTDESALAATKAVTTTVMGAANDVHCRAVG